MQPGNDVKKPSAPFRTLVILVVSLLLPPAVHGQQSEHDFFESRIRPVLIEKCYSCHSSEANELEGGLRVDDPQFFRRGGNSGPAFVPGQPAESLLLEALHHQSLEMPPDEKLADEVIADFATWIARGAVDPRERHDSPPDARVATNHWSFQPLRSPALPVLDDEEMSSAVDSFIRSRLRGKGLELSPPADRRRLLRRVTFALTGLPPTPDEIAAFEQDPSPTAYAEVVERLLASPRYGERWGRHWLDVARYADNKGYVFFEQKEYPWAWTYRDYVISAWNEDLPYDRFILEQLAADQLSNADRSALAAMGFLTVGARFMNNVHDVLDDRIDVVTRGLMGLTVSCARCHDHKFDPIPTADYYALYGVFRSSVEPLLPPPVGPLDDSAAFQEFDTGMQQRLGALEAFITGERQKIIESARSRVAEYLMAVYRKRDHPDTENFMLLTEKGDLNPAMIHRWEKFLERGRRADDPVWRLWHAYSELPAADFSEAAVTLQEKLLHGENAKPLPHTLQQAFLDTPPRDMQDVSDRYGRIFAEIDQRWRKKLDLARREARSPPTEFTDQGDERLRLILYGPQSPPMIPRELSWGFLDLLPDRPTQDEFKKLLGEVEKWSTTQPAAPPRAMVLQDAEAPYEPAIFLRGNPNREGPTVPRRFLSLLTDEQAIAYDRGSGRLQLARDIVHVDNPLTARVLVNRIWLHHFGQGLVDTPSDFGVRSSPPSHPQLLDWLATRLIDQGWSIKAIQREILLSSVYQQSSWTLTDSQYERAREIDPTNRLLWQFPQRRLDFEATRDAILAVTGQLDTRLGGPPEALLTDFSPRRTLYGFVDRMDLPSVMRAFDFPDPATTSPQRDRTTVAPQALFFLNDPFVSDCARALSDRCRVHTADEKERVTHVYLQILGRAPDASELQTAASFLKQQPKPVTSNWQYGYGAMAEDAKQLSGFKQLTHWTGSRWQGGSQLPDPRLGWVFLDRLGGHPSASYDRCAVRRWRATAAGEIEISGVLRHRPEPGNGIRARLVSSRSGVLGTWTAHQEEVETEGIRTQVEVGDTIDFVVDFHGDITHDEHEWPVTIRMHHPSSPEADFWDSQGEFRGPSVDSWTRLVHALLMTNEFVFID